MSSKFDILWVFSSPKPANVPSYVVSGIIPAAYLGIQKVIFLESHEPLRFLQYYKPKLLIIGKAFHSNILYLAQEAKKLNIKVVSVFDDWHFIKDNYENIKKNEMYKSIANLSDNIVVKTTTAANLISNKIGLQAKVIPDCLRYKPCKCIKKISYPFKVAWFGMSTNHDTLVSGLKEINNYNHEVILNIITMDLEKLKKELLKLDLNKISLHFTKWSTSMEKEIKKSDIVIIPYIDDSKRIVKSQNRVTDSMNMGRFVIASKMPFLEEFENYCFLGNIGEGLEWIRYNNNLVIKKTLLGKNYVKEKFSIDNIANIWDDLIKETVNL